MVAGGGARSARPPALSRPARAAEDLKAAAAHLADRPDAFYHLALALAAAHDDRAALAAAERALRLTPGSAEVRSLTEKLRR